MQPTNFEVNASCLGKFTFEFEQVCQQQHIRQVQKEGVIAAVDYQLPFLPGNKTLSAPSLGMQTRDVTHA